MAFRTCLNFSPSIAHPSLLATPHRQFAPSLSPSLSLLLSFPLILSLFLLLFPLSLRLTSIPFLSLSKFYSLAFSRSHLHFRRTFTLALNRPLTSRSRLSNYTTFTLRSPSPLSSATLFTLRSPRERKAFLDATADPRDTTSHADFEGQGPSVIRGSRWIDATDAMD